MSEDIFSLYGDDPFALTRDWLAEAEAVEPNDPEAVCLATSSKDGMPSLRMVLAKKISESGFHFHTNSESQKGREIADNPSAALCFYWKSTRKQIRVSGPVSMLPAAESEAYFKTRPRERQIGAWVSQQSRPFDSLKNIEKEIAACEQRYPPGQDVPRPPYWNGYVLQPLRMEFWIAHPARLHTRFVYTRDALDRPWTAGWLYP